jgi:hypothetical protein
VRAQGSTEAAGRAPQRGEGLVDGFAAQQRGFAPRHVEQRGMVGRVQVAQIDRGVHGRSSETMSAL